MKAHRTDIVSFAFGLVFLALSVWWLLARILGLTLPPVGWFLAGALILVGLLSLLGALRSGRHTDAEAARRAPESTVATPYLGGTPTSGATAAGADEWATDVVTAGPVEARQDGPAEVAYGSSVEAPSTAGPTPTGDPGGATRDPMAGPGEPAGSPPTPSPAPLGDGQDVDPEPVTRELPAAGPPQWPAESPRTDGDVPGHDERSTG
ncbi:hypothetical protein GA0070604_5548 [Micromonospora eburnea]|uniref:Uncharacterized protein n=1 Tax=Micromonospora eburnea TaxID=227316 RepID=A0A1C6VHZ6_9ACTN|nr:hypothetical protein GA0070604_5548 [Micromonospora eburnea]